VSSERNYNAGSGPSVTLSVIASKSCGQATSSRAVAVAGPTATVSNGSSPSVIQAVLTGTSPWTVIWSDNVTQSNIVSSPVTRTVSPGVYSVTAVSDHNCSGTSSGSATVLGTPSIAARTADADSSSVHVTWSLVSNATAYRIERTNCVSCGWSAAFTSNSASVQAYDDHVTASTSPVTYLYRVVALASGIQSFASSTDFATTATTMFAESIVSGTRIRGVHVKELRMAIDAVRLSAGLTPYTTAWVAEGWADYSPPTGHVMAVHVGAMRRALDDAMSILNGSHVIRTNPSGRILAIDSNQLREGVR
jgi:hypothetical protein